MAGSGVSFLSLSYLIEISVVLNLAYRELKFPELHDKLERTITKILSDADKAEIPNNPEYPEYAKLKSLISPNGNTSLWTNVEVREFFFAKLIKPRRSLAIVNWSILANVVALAIFTSLSGIQFDLGWRDYDQSVPGLALGVLLAFTVLDIVCLRRGTLITLLLQFLAIVILIALANSLGLRFNFSGVWLVAFGILVIFTFLPLIFIKMSTLCEVFLFGDDGKSGIVHQLRTEMFERKAAYDERINKDAENLNL